MADPDADSSALIQRAKRGDQQSLNQLFERNAPKLLGRIRLMMGEQARRHAESGDFLQGVFVEVLEGFDRFQPKDENAFVKWAAQIARNNIRDHLRRKREGSLITLAERLVEDRDSLDRPDGRAAHSELVEHLVDSISELPDDQQLVVELRQFEGMSFAEIGERMGRTENAARLLHNRALIALGALFKRLR